ncbi:alpha/beta hydrolase [Streptomyces sp. GC420]|uniref:alpha/beta hydrolase n=1 Tax=Streptomyces sp. GC420 TaxID=2697568 RepID=UPI001414FC94|nr:prolyl oligopeptidase family serine peptidase [Streptomyces sp. GC420]NBM16360.1 prolyl oligopeptidase family serine peptidase [Streptomyces sp. GC420]
MRTGRAAALAATTVLGAGAAVIAAGRLASGAALKNVPGRPLPIEPELTVHSVAAGRITLTRSLASQRPGTYGLTSRHSHAVIGPLVEGAAPGPDTVVRRLERVTHGELRPGDRLWLTPQVHLGDPRSALGLDHADVDIPGELGTLPAWFVPQARDTWMITVHGLGTTREHPMVVMPFLHRLRFPVLDLAYRGDLGAPRSPDGLGHLGDSEWRDLDAAIRYAVRYGAERVVLHGWSTGASMALHAAANSAQRHRIAGLVLDSPVLDWQVTLRALAAANRTPRPVIPLAVRAAQGSTGAHPDRLAEAADHRALQVPTLLVHGPDDVLAPWEDSRRLAGLRPDLVTLHTVRNAPHSAMWNADPAAYEERLRRFLTPLM